MTYSESAEGIMITLTRAIKEVKAHSCDVAEFLEDMGEHEYYDAGDVLRWLGY